MDFKHRGSSEGSSKPSSNSIMLETARNFDPKQSFTTQYDTSNMCLDASVQQSFPAYQPPLGNQPIPVYCPEQEVKKQDQVEAPSPVIGSKILDWNPRLMLNNLSFLEQKIHQVQDIVRSMISQEGQFTNRAGELAAQQRLVTADLTSIIIQLISTAGTLLPSIKNSSLSNNLSAGPLGKMIDPPSSLSFNDVSLDRAKASEYEELMKGLTSAVDEGDELIKYMNACGGEGTDSVLVEDHDVKETDDGADGDNLPPGSYEVLQLEKEEILAPHTHFCSICGKGFKRDANLRMHMRGHGDEYKTPAALAKPSKEVSSEPVPIKRYSCPFVGCKRNKEHKKFQPLKTILCVKNHYKRSHCDKSYICSRCKTKKFSVIADLKTHEKHCGRDKWLCSCGTTFSRKDKLFGHVALFQGHTPALPQLDDAKFSVTSEQVQSNNLMSGGSNGYNFGSSSDDISLLDIKGMDDDRSFFLPMNFDSCNFAGLDEFPRPPFEVHESSFSVLPGSFNYPQINGESSNPVHLG